MDGGRRASESEVIEQPRNTLIEHGAIVTAGLVAEGRDEPDRPSSPRPHAPSAPQ